MNREEYVILVNSNDQEIGHMEKQQAHVAGLLHRAFSVFIFNSQNQLLLHQRAASKYHSPLLWTNTCCSHPRPKETVLDAAQRRLQEEMGMQTDLQIVDSIMYKATLDQGLTEHEFDYILIGFSDVLPVINQAEVETYLYLTLAEIKQKIALEPNQYTEWFKLIMPKLASYIK
jgi:isopentenyl-diphosphate delta-isomerase